MYTIKSKNSSKDPWIWMYLYKNLNIRSKRYKNNGLFYLSITRVKEIFSGVKKVVINP